MALCIARSPAEGPQRAPTTVLSAAMSERISCRQAIVALNQSGVEASATACLLNCSVDVVYFWLHRHTETNDLNDRPRSGRPPLYADTDKLRIIAFYCQTQPLPGCGRWTFLWAQEHLNASPDLVGFTPGKSTIHRILEWSQAPSVGLLPSHHRPQLFSQDGAPSGLVLLSTPTPVLLRRISGNPTPQTARPSFANR